VATVQPQVLLEDAMEELVVGGIAQLAELQEREGGAVGRREVAEEVIAAVEQLLEYVEPRTHLSTERGHALGVGVRAFESLLDGRPYLFGDALSAADCVAFPFLKYAAIRDPADDELFHRVLEEYQPLGDGHPKLAAWIERVNAHPRGL